MGKTSNADRKAAEAGVQYAQRNSGGASEKSSITRSQVPLVPSRGEVITLEHVQRLTNEADHFQELK